VTCSVLPGEMHGCPWLSLGHLERFLPIILLPRASCRKLLHLRVLESVPAGVQAVKTTKAANRQNGMFFILGVL
jgi:hypothetical protein